MDASARETDICFCSLGTIPSEIGQLERLKILQIEDNYITGPMPEGICDLKDADNGLLALGADCEDSAWVNCTCCTCCAAPCPVVNIPLTRRFLLEEEEGIPMGKMDRLVRRLFSFDGLILS